MSQNLAGLGMQQHQSVLFIKNFGEVNKKLEPLKFCSSMSNILFIQLNNINPQLITISEDIKEAINLNIVWQLSSN